MKRIASRRNDANEVLDVGKSLQLERLLSYSNHTRVSLIPKLSESVEVRYNTNATRESLPNLQNPTKPSRNGSSYRCSAESATGHPQQAAFTLLQTKQSNQFKNFNHLQTSNHKAPEVRAFESPYWAGNYNSGAQSIQNSIGNVRRSR